MGLIPRRVLFGNPERMAPRISWIAPRDGVMNIWIAQIACEPMGEDVARSSIQEV